MTEGQKSLWWSRAGVWMRHYLQADRIASFCRYTANRFLADHCLRQAAGLSYVSLLAIVPLLAIGGEVAAPTPHRVECGQLRQW